MLNNEPSSYDSVSETFIEWKRTLLESIRSSVYRAIDRDWNRLRQAKTAEQLSTRENAKSALSALEGTWCLLKSGHADPTFDYLAAIACQTHSTIRFRWTCSQVSALTESVDPTNEDLHARSKSIVYNVLVLLRKGFPGQLNALIADLPYQGDVCLLDSVDSIIAAGIYYGWQPKLEMGRQLRRLRSVN